jgi:Ti-type conjugative transfer relaxase TraA
VAELATTLLGSDGLTANESTFERRDVVRAVAERAANGAHLDAIEIAVEHALTHPESVVLERQGRGGGALHTTRDLLEIEARLIDTAAALHNQAHSALDPVQAERILAERRELTAEQRVAVWSLVTSGAGVEVVVGKAGAGKTTALSLAREIFEGADRRVFGTALSARAAEELEVSAGIASVTLSRFVGELDEGSAALSPRDVVVVDEAGMVGTRTLARLVGAVRETGSKLVLVGDPRQLPEIEAGGAFGALATRLAALELTENRRQHERWERIALDELRSGDVVPALAAYDDHGRIHLAGTMAEARQNLVGRWLNARDAGEVAFMLAVNRRDVAALNREAREMLRQRGSLGADLVRAPGRSFAFGDEVICLRNARRLGVINGTRGTVAELAAGHLIIDTAAGPRTLPPSYLDARHLDYGYASTVHKAQGATYDRAFVLATDSLTREAGYVAMSRARRGTELFVTAGAFEHGLGPEVPEVEPLARTAARLSESRAKVLASSHLEVGPPVGNVVAVPSATAWGTGAENPRPVPSPEIVQLAAQGIDSVRDDLTMVDTAANRSSVRVQAALGPPPDSALERARYDRLTEEINRYREQHEVEEDDPLGPEPFEARARLDHRVLAAEIRLYQRAHGRELEPPGLEFGLGR